MTGLSDTLQVTPSKELPKHRQPNLPLHRPILLLPQTLPLIFQRQILPKRALLKLRQYPTQLRLSILDHLPLALIDLMIPIPEPRVQRLDHRLDLPCN